MVLWCWLLAGCGWPGHVYEPFVDTGLWFPSESHSETASGATLSDTDSAVSSSNPDTPSSYEMTSARLVTTRVFLCGDPAARSTLGPFQPSVTLWSQPTEHATSGAVVFDVNGDGEEDLWFADTEGGALYVQEEGAFVSTPITDLFGDSDVRTARGGAVADYDADGDVDLFLVREDGPDRLFRNEGAGVWTDVTAPLFRVQDVALSHAARWIDLDGDTDLDLWVLNEEASAASHMYRNNNGNFDLESLDMLLADRGRWVDVSDVHGMDLTGDGIPELFSWHRSALDGHFVRLWRINQAGVFAPDQNPVGVARAALVMTPTYVSGNQQMDWFVGGDQGFWALQGSAVDELSWQNVQASAWGLNGGSLNGIDVTGVYAGDLNHDGHEDLLLDREPFTFGSDAWMDNQDRLYLMGGLGEINDRAADYALDMMKAGRGGALIDVNQDGWLDVVRRNRDGHNTLQLARCGAEPSIQVRLSSVGGNRTALGARVELVEPGGTQVRWVFDAAPPGSSRSPVVHFGLAGAVTAERTLRVVWPDGRVSLNALDTLGGLSSTSFEVVVYRETLDD